MFIFPPYFPRSTQLCGTTYGVSGRRCSTGGSPLFFRDEASVNDFGVGSGVLAEPCFVLPAEPPAPVAPVLPPPPVQALSIADPATTAEP